MKTLAVTAISILLLAAVFAAGSVFGWIKHSKTYCPPDYRTVIVHDTVIQILPKPIKELIVKDRLVEVSVKDTVHVYHTDTLYIGVPYMEREYKDSNYYAVVGGYQPELLRLETYNTTRTEYTEIRKWGIGLQAGFGVSYYDGFRALPYLGIGVTYNLIFF